MRRRRWVVKAGSNMVCGGGPLLVRAWMRQIAELKRRHGVEVIWVTSGAIASARERKTFPFQSRAHARARAPKMRGRELSEKQALSAIGQPLVMDLYNIALQTSGLLGAQILLTYDDLADGARRRNFQNTVEKLLEWKVTPILNENDAVATQEIRFGDNDSLSAKVAAVCSADRLVILTDVDGLYDRDPRENADARLVRELGRVTPEILRATGRNAGSRRGTGGMFSKLCAAQEATRRGIETWLVRGDRPSILLDVADDHATGTRIGRSKKTRKGKKTRKAQKATKR